MKNQVGRIPEQKSEMPNTTSHEGLFKPDSAEAQVQSEAHACHVADSEAEHAWVRMRTQAHKHYFDKFPGLDPLKRNCAH